MINLTKYKLSKIFIFNFIVSLLLFYFIYHSVYGNRGIIAYLKLNKDYEQAVTELDKLRSDRIMIEHKVKLLEPSTLDKDMLDEEARNISGLALPDEEILLLPKKSNLYNEK